MAQPTDSKELEVIVAQELYDTSTSKLKKIIATLLPKDADFSKVDLWVINTKIHWETCTQNWHLAQHEFSMDVVPVPMSQMAARPSAPKESLQLAAPLISRTITPNVAPNTSTTPVSQIVLLGGSTTKRCKKGSQKKDNFNMPLPSPKPLTKGDTVVTARSLKKPQLQETGVLSTDKVVVATKVHHPRGPSHIKPLLASVSIKGGGFDKDVPDDL
ncbi:hypothetical protein IW262DRAFT_1297993 [Armillaria fumosa]|nr:hypothetical protein IW262DRAFT_1297993 [Armillaria fumosa]